MIRGHVYIRMKYDLNVFLLFEGAPGGRWEQARDVTGANVLRRCSDRQGLCCGDGRGLWIKSGLA